jgi:hypothetical protein
MKERDAFGWFIVGLNWYTIIVIGGLLAFVSGLLRRIHDFWLIVRKEEDIQKYNISHDPKRLLISLVTLFMMGSSLPLTLECIKMEPRADLTPIFTPTSHGENAKS